MDKRHKITLGMIRATGRDCNLQREPRGWVATVAGVRSETWDRPEHAAEHAMRKWRKQNEQAR